MPQGEILAENVIYTRRNFINETDLELVNAIMMDAIDKSSSLLFIFSFALIDLVSNNRLIVLRYIIETLSIIHGETKLNMICPFGGDPEQHYGRANLDHQSMIYKRNVQSVLHFLFNQYLKQNICNK